MADGKLLLPKFRSGIPVRLHRPLGGSIRNATVSRDSSGKYYVSITIETGKPTPEPGEVKPSTAVGIDVGLGRVLAASRFAPTSKRHYECGYMYRELKLSEREWRCPGCGERVARDEHAAENIRYYAIRQYFSTYSGVERTGVSPRAVRRSGTGEAASFRKRPTAAPESHLSLKVVCSLNLRN